MKRDDTILLLTSTFPRWKKDQVPLFVYDQAKIMKNFFGSVLVLAPHYPHARRGEILEGIQISRFQYFYPESSQNIAYGGFKTNNNVIAVVKAICYVLMQIIYTLIISIKHKPKVINAHWLLPQGLSALLAKQVFGSKMIVNIHGGDVFTLNSRFSRAIKKAILKRSDVVIANSSVTKREAQLLLDREYVVIPEIVDVEKFTSAHKNKEKHDGFNIVFIGRLSEEKGVIYLLEAVNLIKKNMNSKDMQLKIVGDGPERAKLQQYVDSSRLNSFVEFVGWKQRDELVDIFKTTDVFVGPSIKSDSGWKEAFGIVFAEASSAGVPVITTDQGGMIDIVDDGNTGFIIDQKSAKLIAEKLNVLYDDRGYSRMMGEKAHKRAIKLFSKNAVQTKYKKILDEVMSL